jgi:phage/plasmid-associated DNA primase
MNSAPDMSCVDGGVKRRVRIIPFESKFVDDVTDPKWEGMENVYPLDSKLKQKMNEWGPSLMYMMIKWYHEIYEVEGLGENTTPECIKIATKDMFSDHDSELFDYLEANIEKVDESEWTKDTKPILSSEIFERISHHQKKYKLKNLRAILDEHFGKKYYKKDHDMRNKDNVGPRWKECIIYHRWKKDPNNFMFFMN